MKFGQRLLAQLHQPWADKYLPYSDLKAILKQVVHTLNDSSTAAEGEFLSSLLRALQSIDVFFKDMENSYANRLRSIADSLASPSGVSSSSTP